jgi:hypothetical protein
MTELKNAGVDVTPEVSLFASALLYSLFRHPFLFPAHLGWNGFTYHSALSSKIQNLQNMMGSIGEPGQAGDDVGGRKK